MEGTRLFHADDAKAVATMVREIEETTGKILDNVHIRQSLYDPSKMPPTQYNAYEYCVRGISLSFHIPKEGSAANSPQT